MSRLTDKAVSFFNKNYNNIYYEKLWRYENLGEPEEINAKLKELERLADMEFTKEHCDLYSENEMLKEGIKVYKKALEIAEKTIKQMCPPIAMGGIVPKGFNETKDSKYFLEQAKKDLDNK